jgi:hypothetical protein
MSYIHHSPAQPIFHGLVIPVLLSEECATDHETLYFVRSQVLKAASMKMTLFWDIARAVSCK